MKLITKYPDGYEADSEGVKRFRNAMMLKLHQKREEGKHGWQSSRSNYWGCTVRDLESQLRAHLAKGDVVDVANYCMMIWNRRNPRGLL